MESNEFMETRTLKFEWILHNVGELFDSSKGESKSKVTKSVLFGGGRWQVMFYANSGTTNADGAGFVSLYLSCEPTQEEKEIAVDGRNKWVREGQYTFNFELRNIQRNICFQTKEARNHAFSWKTVNWGWAQFARRDTVYTNATTVRSADALLIICTITAAPIPPSPPSPILRRPVPKDLLNSLGSLLDDPLYSDVEFVLPRRRRGTRPGDAKPRIIYATRKLLRRVDYFDTMFRSGFAESASVATKHDSLASDLTMVQDVDMLSPGADVDMDVMDGSDARSTSRFEDSDDEDDNYDYDLESYTEDDTDSEDSVVNEDETTGTGPPQICSPSLPGSTTEDSPNDASAQHQEQEPLISIPEELIADDEDSKTTSEIAEGEQEDTEERNVQRKLSHPSSPRSQAMTPQEPSGDQSQAGLQLGTMTASEAGKKLQTKPASRKTSGRRVNKAEKVVPGPKKVRVVVKDAAYATYRAVLYYIYTDTLTFAPLASSFPSRTTPITQAPSRSDEATDKPPYTRKPVPGFGEPSSRREWITAWTFEHPDRPRPCSAKAVYRLADRLDLQELKERAFQHIIRSLTVNNVAYEVFSDFSSAFDDVRKVEVQYFLDHWEQIRSSDTMRNVWQQIRLGRHPGFEEVWPLIAMNLEYKPRELSPPPSEKPQ